jgi:hypothetical protein
MRSTPCSAATPGGAPPPNPLPPGSSLPGAEVKMDFRYKTSRVKQYFNEGRAFRTKTVFCKPSKIGDLARLEHLPS